jgi:hypothetical protein
MLGLIIATVRKSALLAGPVTAFSLGLVLTT